MKNKILLFLFFLALSPSLFGSSVEDSIKQLSWSDRVSIKMFFDEAIKKDQAAHALCFQNKPVCLTGPVLKDKHKTFKDVLCLKGWLAFKKNEHLFPHPNFIFSERLYSDNRFKCLYIYIFNKKSLKECLRTHFDVFKATIASEFTSEQLIAKLEEGYPLSCLLNDDEMLL